mmetsp:Transcript_5149/g.7841  ORF Transcript_5149/g.7841 Transcript_5149/m.7841 type:complete len:288 (+) Transcript_5149:1283-2146(+)
MGYSNSRCVEKFYSTFSEIQGSRKSIPQAVLGRCKALLFCHVNAGGLIVSSGYGYACVIRKIHRKNDGEWDWSGPCFLSYSSVGGGLNIGFEQTDSIVVINSDEPIEELLENRPIVLGQSVTLVAGPNTESNGDLANERHTKDSFIYTRSRGVCAGVQITGAVLAFRAKDNKKYYQDLTVTAECILKGCVPAPSDSHDLYNLLDKSMIQEVPRKNSTNSMTALKLPPQDESEPHSAAARHSHGNDPPYQWWELNKWDNVFARYFVLVFIAFVLSKYCCNCIFKMITN